MDDKYVCIYVHLCIHIFIAGFMELLSCSEAREEFAPAPEVASPEEG